MNRKLLVVFLGLLFSVGNVFGAEKRVAPDAVDRAISNLGTESEEKSTADLFDESMFVDLITRRGVIELRFLLPACKYVLEHQETEVNKMYTVDVDQFHGTAPVVTDVDEESFCEEFVKNIVKHHNAIVVERRSEFYYDIFPVSEKFKETSDGEFYMAKIDTSHIDVSDLTDYSALSHMYGIFHSADNSIVCVMSHNVCKSDENGLLFESGNWGLDYYTYEDAQEKSYRMETYNAAPVALEAYHDTVVKYLKPISQDGVVQITADLY